MGSLRCGKCGKDSSGLYGLAGTCYECEKAVWLEAHTGPLEKKLDKLTRAFSEAREVICAVAGLGECLCIETDAGTLLCSKCRAKRYLVKYKEGSNE